MEDIWRKEKEYCLNCVNKPCSNNGCPLNNDIPSFIHESDPQKAFDIITKTSVLPAICGRICPHSKQCQGSCIRGIKGEPVKIGQVEAEIGDLSLENGYNIKKGNIEEIINITKNVDTNKVSDIISNKKVAIIGSGPCGLTCASFLARYGVKVTIFEKYEKLGGLLRHGIPDFRLDRTIVEKTIDKILKQGIEVKNNTELGKDISIEKLIKDFDAVFLAIGANKSNKTLKKDNTINGNEFLEKLNVIQEKYDKNINNINLSMDMTDEEKTFIQQVKDLTNKRIAIQGGGNVAMDCARTFKRLGADVSIVYRRDFEQMPAEGYEIQDSKNEGINFLVKTNIIDFEPINKKLKCIKTELIKSADDDRLKPVDINGSEFDIEIDYLVFAIGSKIEEKIINNERIEKNKWGYVSTDENYHTSVDKVYAGGDVIGTKATVAFAAMNGREAAKNIVMDFLN